MNKTNTHDSGRVSRVGVSFLFLLSFLVGCVFMYFAFPWATEALHDHDESHSEAHEHEHDHEHEHEHEQEHEHEELLGLSVQALANIGLYVEEEYTLELSAQDYVATTVFPGVVSYKPGRSLVDIPSPVDGVVTKIYAEEGDLLYPGAPLFEVQPTHKEIASCQLELLSLLQKSDVLESERQRLGNLEAGIAPKSQREIQLQIQENNASIEAQKQSLRFLGVPLKVIEETLIQNRELLTTLIVRTPTVTEDGRSLAINVGSSPAVENTPLSRDARVVPILEKLSVEKGQTVSLGSSLCAVSNLSTVTIEGRGFESDIGALNAAFGSQSPIKAKFRAPGAGTEVDTIEGLTIRSVSNRLDETSHTFSFFIELDNYLLEPESRGEGVYKPNWRFKPGQRCDLEAPTTTLSNVFVVPTSAVAQDGIESFVYEYAGEEDGMPLWRRRSVSIARQTTREIALRNDGSLSSGMRIAKSGAFQLYMAENSGEGKLQSSCSCGDHEH
ncbi:MAG: hypothetical protein Q4G03_00475 [Planctomycetia bacterium]|nr:hypothetical protein [Planctomycetia bacterium]